MTEENINQEFKLKKKDKTRNYLSKEINQIKLMCKHKKCCRVSNYIDHLLIEAFTITGFVSIFALASLVGIPIGITISAINWIKNLCNNCMN